MTQFLPTILARLSAVLGDKKGVTVVEYGVLLALILGVAIVAIGPLATAVAGEFTAITGSITGA